jgi:hypothetical protein
MPDVPDVLRAEEYRALRSTIQQRGSLRVVVFLLTISVWATTILIVAARFQLPYFSLIPLVVLVAGFEAVFALHTGVERVGRYIAAHHEPASNGEARWEEVAAKFRGAGGGANPLFPAVFIGAALINMTFGFLFGFDGNEPFSFDKTPGWIPVVLLHLGAIARVLMASRFATGQRARDLEEFARLLKSG